MQKYHFVFFCEITISYTAYLYGVDVLLGIAGFCQLNKKTPLPCS